MPAHSSRSQRRRQSGRSQPRRQVRPVAPPEPVDYSQDYAYVRQDLKQIAFWSLLLFAGMIALYFVM